MPSIGPLEIAIVLIILLVIFGPKKLPELGRSAGAGIRELKDSLTGSDDEETPKPVKVEAERDDEDKPAKSPADTDPKAEQESADAEVEPDREPIDGSETRS